MACGTSCRRLCGKTSGTCSPGSFSLISMCRSPGIGSQFRTALKAGANMCERDLPRMRPNCLGLSQPSGCKGFRSQMRIHNSLHFACNINGLCAYLNRANIQNLRSGKSEASAICEAVDNMRASAVSLQ